MLPPAPVISIFLFLIFISKRPSIGFTCCLPITSVTLRLLKLSIECNFKDGAPGVYVDKKKIASIGFRISKGKTYHGISLNFDIDLSPFKQINPCGYQGLEVTQIKDLNKDISKLQLHEIIIDLLRKVF